MPRVLQRFFALYLFAQVLLIAALLSGCARPPGLQKPKALAPGQKPVITVIPGGPQKHWLEAKRGAEAAAKQFGAEIIWKAPDGIDPLGMQKAMMVTATKKSHGIALAPLDPTQLMRFVREATRMGLAVVVFDRDVYTIQNKLTYIHTDEEKARALKQAAKEVVPDYYQMGYLSVKSIMDFRKHNPPPREIKIAPRVVNSAAKTSRS